MQNYLKQHKKHPERDAFMFGASGGNPAASPTAVGSRSRPLAGLIQAGFDHRLLERPPDVRAYADALPGSIPVR